MSSETLLKVSEEQKKIGYDTYGRGYIRGFIHRVNNRLFHLKKNLQIFILYQEPLGDLEQN